MATGGTIPSNRTQTVTFYNTTGVIEKEKNVYYVPRFSKTGATVGQEVRTAYLNAFNVVCPPSSAYTDINISQWSPQDRSLLVRGNIDDFRAVTDEGACLNYFIITRTISKTSGETTTSQAFYYGFFITGVEQAGGGSVRITAEPDDFTNVFYLHNKHVLTSSNISNDYEPFNEKMKNCYVNRQHYNRVKNPIFKSVYNCLLTPFTSSDNIGSVNDIISFRRLTIQGEINYGNFKILAIRIAEGQVSLKLEDQDTSRATVNLPTEFSYSIYNVNQSAYHSVRTLDSWTKNESESKVITQNDNMRIFVNQEQTFKFKYQRRDEKYPISIYEGNFTKEEINTINNAESFDSLSQTLRTKIIHSCLSYLVVETRSVEALIKYYAEWESSGQPTKIKKSYVKHGEKIGYSELYRPNATLCIPFMNIPDEFSQFYSDLSSIKFYYLVKYTTDIERTIQVSGGGASYLDRMLDIINNKSISDYIYSIYYAKSVGIRESEIEVDYSGTYISVSYLLHCPYAIPSSDTDITVNSVAFRTGLNLSGLVTDMSAGASNTDTGAIITVQWADSSHIGSILSIDVQCPAICISQRPLEVFSLHIEEKPPVNIQSIYYDPVIECEPYKFYSLSYYSNYELVYKKARYFQQETATGYTIDNFHYLSVNGAIKEGIVARYELDGFETLYFNEGLVFTSSTSLPLVSDSYMSYYYQNKAQMKNQFAVAEKNFQYDMLQHFFVSGPNAVGYSAGKGGMRGGGAGAGASAGLETANQLMQMVDEHIDYVQSKEIIGMNQKAKLADVGAQPDTIKQTGSDIYYEINNHQAHMFFNHYTIDDMSYNSIAKLLERVGYQVNLYDDIHAISRVGWDYVKLNGFDFNPSVNIMTEQEDSIRKIFSEGVTLLHDKSYLTSGHNYETILDE